MNQSTAILHLIPLTGNFACATVFIKNFAPELTHEKISSLFPTTVKIALGNKKLRPGEFRYALPFYSSRTRLKLIGKNRTAYVVFEDTEAAILARKAMSGYESFILSKLPSLNVRSSATRMKFKLRHLLYITLFVHKIKPNLMDMEVNICIPVHPIDVIFAGYPMSPGYVGQSLYPSVPSPPSPYTPNLSALNLSPYSALPGMYGGNPYHQMMSAVPPMDEARYSLSGILLPFSSSLLVLTTLDLFDAKGNAASNGLFVDCLPYNIRENQIHAIFSRQIGFKVLPHQHASNTHQTPHTKRPYQTPHTKRPYQTPVPNARTKRPYQTPVPNARTKRPYQTPVPNARTKHPYQTPGPNTHFPNTHPNTQTYLTRTSNTSRHSWE
jgi:hypothetical protein